MKLIVAGTRTFDDYDLLRDRLDFYLSNVHEEIEIVSGGAKGADSLGERYAKERGLPVKLFPAEWRLYGKIAGTLRNGRMADYGTHAVVFWNGRSPGSKNMIELCKLHRLNYRVVMYLEESNARLIRSEVG